MTVKQTSEKPRVGDGTPGPGRPKGSQNAMTRACKDVIAQAAADIGGGDRLAEWIKEDAQNERAFWATIYPKLLPLTLAGDLESPINIAVRHVLAGS